VAGRSARVLDARYWSRYGVAVVFVAFGMVFSSAVPALRDRTPYLAVLGGVIATSSYGGLGPGIFATFVGGLATDYFLVPPLHQAIGNPGDFERLAVFVVIGVLTTLRSAEIHRAAAQREELLRGAESANRAKDEFLAMVSHELRSPLAAIRMWAAVLRTAGLDEAKRRRALQAIEDGAVLQGRLVGDLLDVSRIVSGKLALDCALIDPAETARTAVDAIRTAAAEKRIDLDEAIAVDAGVLWADATRFKQIVWNLLSNAVKFTPQGGHVQLRLERVDHGVRLTVRDSGEGIAPDVLPHVFERFRQADSSTTRRHGGLGLGLAIVRHLVDAHGGTIEARSDGRGRGATFVVTLPAAAAPPAEVPAVHPGARRTGTSTSLLDGIAVLVVDDDRDAREAIATVLHGSGADVSSVGSTAGALARLGTHPPDVLVADIAMPEDDGYALIAAVRAQGIQVPAAALTGVAAEEHRRRALAAGFGAYLTKPVDPTELVDAVAELAHVSPR